MLPVMENRIIRMLAEEDSYAKGPDGDSYS